MTHDERSGKIIIPKLPHMVLANFATQNISLSDTNEVILPASFAFLGSHDLPHQEDHPESLILEGEEIHCQFIPVGYHQKEKRQ